MANNSFNCGLEAALAVIGGKWKPLVLFNLAQNVHRYGELRRAVGGVTDKVLIQQLKELERDEIVERVDFHEIPPKVEYSLTPFGQSLATALGALCQWGTEHMQTVERIAERRTSALAQP
ncbi:winged helix-turn-helix transcriptional regulator [Pseudomonas sp. PAMC 25886]|uniref:winged helix-turn-helix transcriptional regulator n=1 Tax=Pseudomonas sp. PAMC 25886 TaxID=1125977 RepID=UPI0002891098|nr:helix-turn-helix domain-containing protein [Pseudomonas sp. PAMC 25886]